jgi:DNA invertase Pin-like site-specific DNA recombinase
MDADRTPPRRVVLYARVSTEYVAKNVSTHPCWHADTAAFHCPWCPVTATDSSIIAMHIRGHREQHAREHKKWTTWKGAKRNQDPEVQLTELRPWAARMGAKVVAEVVERASGAADPRDRTGLEELLALAHQRKMDAVLVFALDRLTRRGMMDLLALLQHFRDKGVTVLSLKDRWLETSPGPVGDLIIAVLGFVAQFERQRLSERVKAGMAAAGIPYGRPPVIQDRMTLRRLIAEGLSLAKIASRVKVNESTISRYVRKDAELLTLWNATRTKQWPPWIPRERKPEGFRALYPEASSPGGAAAPPRASPHADSASEP